MSTYYAAKNPTLPDFWDLRQTRYKPELARGKEHPHDVMACGFTAQGLRDLCTLHNFDADLSNLPKES